MNQRRVPLEIHKQMPFSWALNPELTISNISASIQARKPGATIDTDALFLVKIPNIVCYSDGP